MDGLTKKQKGFVKDYIETGNGQQSALNNYDIEGEDKLNIARAIASENLTKPTIVNAIKSIAEQIPDSLLVEKLTALLNKEEVITKNNMTSGEIDTIPTGEIDVQAVSKGLDMTFKLKGSYAAEKVINLNITQQTPEQLIKAKAFDKWMKQQTQ